MATSSKPSWAGTAAIAMTPSCCGTVCTVRTRPFYYMLLICNIVIPQVLWIPKLRTSPVWLFLVSGVVLVGMWLERFIIVVVSLHRDFLTSSWGMYYPTRWDWMTYVGTIGLFLSAMFLFVRLLPMISIFEMRTLLPEAEVKE